MDPIRIDSEVGAVKSNGALGSRVGAAWRHFADPGDSICGEGWFVWRFAAAFVVFGCGAIEGFFADAFAVLAADPVDVEGKVFAVFHLGALESRRNADWNSISEDNLIRQRTAAFIIFSC